ncbi:MAG: hypothetical protein M0Q53_10115 [Prolixibacteraceae bacterium]|jgi:hypothetical protein|nr:hypothetical protein [Prolixibacteraceae bacterium]
MEFKTDWLQAKKRFEALWEREITDRCCISVKGWKNKKLYIQPNRPKDLNTQWLDGEYILKTELRKMEHTFYGGESFPLIFLNLGPCSHAASFKGVKHVFRDESVWFDPLPEEEGLNIEDDPNSFIEKKTYELAEYYVTNSKGRYFVSMPDNCGNLDALAHIRRSEQLLLDMLLDPDEVNAALKKVNIAWERITRKSFDIIKLNNEGGGCNGWLDVWAPGLLAEMQADISVMISEEMYSQFVVPELISQSEVLQYPLYHLDGQEQAKFIDQICSVKKLRMIQWTNVDGQPSPVEFIPEMRRIQQHDKCVLAKVRTVKEAETLLKELSSKGLYVLIDSMLNSEQEVKDVIKMAEKYTHE